MICNNLETFLASLKSGRILKGCVVTFSAPAVAGMAAEAGFDFCWIDSEHGGIDRQTAMTRIMALKESGFDRWLKRGVQYFGIINDTSAMMLGFREREMMSRF